MMVNQLKSLETTLAGALRREQMAETSIKKLEAEIEQLNRLVWSIFFFISQLISKLWKGKRERVSEFLNRQLISYFTGSSKRGRYQEQ